MLADEDFGVVWVGKQEGWWVGEESWGEKGREKRGEKRKETTKKKSEKKMAARGGPGRAEKWLRYTEEGGDGKER